MTPGEAVSRKQRGILDDTGHAGVSVEESVQWTTITDTFQYPRDVLPEGLPIWDELVYERYQRQAANDRAIVEYLLNVTPDPVADLASQAPRPSLWTRIGAWFR